MDAAPRAVISKQKATRNHHNVSLRVPPQVKKLLPVTVGIVIVLMVMGILLVRFVRETDGFEERCGGGGCWGYRLDLYKYRKLALLRFWNDRGLEITYELPDLVVERVSEDQWLSVDRALFLNFRFRPADDSSAEGSRVRILYDFQTGQLFLDSPMQLWRVADYRSGNPARNWLTPAQFNSALEALQ